MDKNREMLLILAKALDFSWATTMSLLFLGAKDHRITAQELKELESEFGRLNVETSPQRSGVLSVAQECRRSRIPTSRRQPALAHAMTDELTGREHRQ